MPAGSRASKPAGTRIFGRKWSQAMKITTIGLLAALVLLTACNTVEGAGRDIESAGDTIEKTAKDAKDDAGAD
jgi:predicted small secreted protein